MCERYGIPPDAGAAWEAGGGGKFSFKIDKKGRRGSKGHVGQVAAVPKPGQITALDGPS